MTKKSDAPAIRFKGFSDAWEQRKLGDMMNVDDVTEILAVNLIGAVPDDEQIVISTNRGEPLVGSDSLAGKAYMNICRRIMGEEVPFLDLNQKHGVFEKLKDMFKKN